MDASHPATYAMAARCQNCQQHTTLRFTWGVGVPRLPKLLGACPHCGVEEDMEITGPAPNMDIPRRPW